ncbi:MAG: MoaD/ThiS family protein [Saprospiraceae bacterium]
MSIKILAFGKVSELVGKSTWSATEIKDTKELKEHLEKEFPELKNISYFIAVNKSLIESEIILNPEDVVALMPAFSGG